MTASPLVDAFFDPATNTVTYAVADPATGRAVVIDPVLDYEAATGRVCAASVEAVLARIAERGWTLDRVLETHAHADHLTGAQVIRERTGVPIGVGARIGEVQKTFGPLFEAEDATAAAFDAL